MPKKTAEQKLIEIHREKGIDWLWKQVYFLRLLQAPPKFTKRKIEATKPTEASGQSK